MRNYRGRLPEIKRFGSWIPRECLYHSPRSDEFEWPSREAIIRSQKRNIASSQKKTTGDHDGLRRTTGRTAGHIWILSSDTDLKLLLLIIAHAGDAGHRGAETIFDALHVKYFWEGIRDDTRAFVSDCLHCVLAKCGNKVPRPLSSTLHADKPNGVLHFDYIFLGDSTEQRKYALVLKDDLSGYCWLNLLQMRTHQMLHQFCHVGSGCFHHLPFGFRTKAPTSKTNSYLMWPMYMEFTII